MVIITIVTAIGFVLSLGLYALTESVTLAVTFGTTFYHFAIRLLSGTIIAFIFKNQINYRKKWFQPLKFEKKLYEILRVKKWKGRMPTYSPETFSIDNSAEHLVMATCQSEIVHEINIVLSFLPLLMGIWFKPFIVFLLTSTGGAIFDMMFVIIQRYNRPRLIKLLERKDRRIK